MIEDIIHRLVKNYFYKIDDKLNVENIINEYLVRQYYKISRVKNILYRDSPKDFYDLYIEMVIEHKNFRTSFRNPQDDFSRQKQILITGSAGSGKTTFLKNIFLKCIEHRYKLPIFIELRNYNILSNLSFEDFLINQISDKKNSANVKTSSLILEEGEFVFLFDGVEEILIDKKQYFINSLEAFVSKYPKHDFVLTSRPGTEIEYLLQFVVFEILPLSESEIFNFIDNLSVNRDFKMDIRESIHKTLETQNIYELLKNPLFLSIFILHFQTNTNLPSKKSTFFRYIIEFLITQHDAVSKLGYIRERTSGLSKDEIEQVLKYFCFTLYFRGSFIISLDEIFQIFDKLKKLDPNLTFNNENLLYDLITTISILVKDGAYYAFIHYSLLEYFTVLFIKDLSDSNKINFYNKYISSTNNYFSNSFEFWDLCIELDEIGFIRGFIMPVGKNIIQKIKTEPTFLFKIFGVNEIIKHDKYFSYNYIEFVYIKYFKLVDVDFVIRKLHKMVDNGFYESIQQEITDISKELNHSLDYHLSYYNSRLQNNFEDIFDLL